MLSGCCTGCEKQTVSAYSACVNDDSLIVDVYRARGASPWNRTEISAHPGPLTVVNHQGFRPLLGPATASHRKVYQLVVHPQTGESPGIDVDVVDGIHIFVVAIRPGVFERANAKPNMLPLHKLQPNDRIIEVNGRRGDVGELVAQLQMETTWDIKFVHPTEFKCDLCRQGTESLGLDLKFAPGGNTLVIFDIGPGPAERWNEDLDSFGERRPQFAVYDRIIEMNGRRGSPGELLEASVLKDPIEMKVLSYGLSDSDEPQRWDIQTKV